MNAILCEACGSKDTRAYAAGGYRCRRCGHSTAPVKGRIDIAVDECPMCGSRWLVKRQDGYIRCRRCGSLIGDEVPVSPVPVTRLSTTGQAV